MSIRSKVLVACFTFLIVNIAMGFFFYKAEQKLETLALSIYDDAFQGLNYAHKAQTDFVHFALTHHDTIVAITDDDREKLGRLLDNLDVAIQRAMSDKGRVLSQQIRDKIVGIQGGTKPLTPELVDEIDHDMTKLVNRYSTDGVDYRKRAVALAEESKKGFEIVMGAALGLAVITALFILRAIVPPLKHAVKVAMSIADGHLDNAISVKGRSETAALLNALAKMQGAIAENLRRVEEQSRQTEQRAWADSQRKAALEEQTGNFKKKVAHMLDSVSRALNIMRKAVETMQHDVGSTDTNLQQAINVTRQTTEGVTAVAQAAEDLLSSINNISKQATRSASIAENAIGKAQAADKVIQKLAQAANNTSLQIV
jgi:methyl-accepting chemotaxis protein